MATNVIAPPQINQSPSVAAALSQIAIARARVDVLIAANEAQIAAYPLPSSGTPPAQGAKQLIGCMIGLLQSGQLRALGARLDRMAYNLQVM